MSRILPPGAVCIPQYAKEVFRGELFSLFQWQQQLFDGSYATFEMLKRPDSAHVLVVKDQKVAVLHEAQPGRREFYGLPGGRVESGELPLQAAQRELQEEAGITCGTWKLIIVTQPYDKIEWFTYLYVASDCLEFSATSVLSQPGEQCRLMWLDFEELQQLAQQYPARLAGDLLRTLTSVDALRALPEYVPEASSQSDETRVADDA